MPATGVDETMTTPQITALPPAPTPQDSPEAFNDKAFRVLAAQEAFVEEANELAEFVNQKTSDAAVASVSAGQAAQSAEAARDDTIAAKNVVVGVASQFGDVGSAIAFAEDAAQRSFTQAQVAANASQVAELARDAATVAKNAAVAAEQSIDSRAEQITTDATLAAVGAVTTQVESARDVAVAAKDGAELARDAAIAAAGPLYATIEEGRAAVADGETFAVQGSVDVAASIYRRTSASQNTLIAELPSVAGMLGNALPFRGTLANNANLTAPMAQGVWLGSGSRTYIGLPEGYESTGGFSLEVINYSALGAPRFQVQTLSGWNVAADIQWVRLIDANNLPTTDTWRRVGLNNYRGQTAQTDLNRARQPGVWGYSSVLSNMPSDAPTNGFFENMILSGGQVLQTLFKEDVGVSYKKQRLISNSGAVIRDWIDLRNGYIAKLNSSSDIYSITTQGKYLYDGKPSTFPTGAENSGYLFVERLDNFVYYTVVSLTDPSLTWVKSRRVDTGRDWGWHQIGGNSYTPRLPSKAYACFGDSITNGGTYVSTLVTDGIDARRLGFSGCQLAKYSTGAAAAYYDKMSMYQLAKSIAAGDFSEQIAARDWLIANGYNNYTGPLDRVMDVDWSNTGVATIFYGTNDFRQSVPLGQLSDVLSDGSTFFGALNFTIETLISAYPNLRIMLFTPLWRWASGGVGNDADVYPNSIGVYLHQYVDAIKSAGEKYKLPVLDLYRESGFNVLNKDHLFSDGLHPNEAGNAVLSAKINGFLRQQGW